MSLTHDGLQTPLPPSPISLVLGLVVAGLGVAALTQAWWCTGIGVLVFGLLMLINQINGVTRVRVTFSKLLVENERLVMGFLIGPSKQRIPWEEFREAKVVDGKVVATGTSETLEFGKGQPEAELQQLVQKIEAAAQRFKEEGGK